jgi:hypothetical protein
MVRAIALKLGMFVLLGASGAPGFAFAAIPPPVPWLVPPNPTTEDVVYARVEAACMAPITWTVERNDAARTVDVFLQTDYTGYCFDRLPGDTEMYRDFPIGRFAPGILTVRIFRCEREFGTRWCLPVVDALVLSISGVLVPVTVQATSAPSVLALIASVLVVGWLVRRASGRS